MQSKGLASVVYEKKLLFSEAGSSNTPAAVKITPNEVTTPREINLATGQTGTNAAAAQDQGSQNGQSLLYAAVTADSMEQARQFELAAKKLSSVASGRSKMRSPGFSLPPWTPEKWTSAT
jgi:hypothetical protein